MTTELLAIRNELIKEEYSKSLYLFAKHGLGYKDLRPSTHTPICEALEAPTKRKLIVVPRGCFKSTLCSVAFPIWMLLKDPNHRILIDSEIYKNSKNFMREIKAHLESEYLVGVYGEFRNDRVWNESEILINQRTRVYKEASITCSGIGTEKTGQHYSVVICDDLNSPNNSNTPEGCQKVIDHYRYMQAILDPDGILVVVATRYSAADVIGFVMDNEINMKGLI